MLVHILQQKIKENGRVQTLSIFTGFIQVGKNNTYKYIQLQIIKPFHKYYYHSQVVGFSGLPLSYQTWLYQVARTVSLFLHYVILCDQSSSEPERNEKCKYYCTLTVSDVTLVLVLILCVFVLLHLCLSISISLPYMYRQTDLNLGMEVR